MANWICNISAKIAIFRSHETLNMSRVICYNVVILNQRPSTKSQKSTAERLAKENPMNKSTIFTRYNKLAQDHIGIDQPRLKRALGLAQKSNTYYILKHFNTCATSCDCPDYQYRMSQVVRGQCKHMLALQLMAD